MVLMPCYGHCLHLHPTIITFQWERSMAQVRSGDNSDHSFLLFWILVISACRFYLELKHGFVMSNRGREWWFHGYRIIVSCLPNILREIDDCSVDVDFAEWSAEKKMDRWWYQGGSNIFMHTEADLVNVYAVLDYCCFSKKSKLGFSTLLARPNIWALLCLEQIVLSKTV